MNQNDDISIKCPNSEHNNNVKFVCFDESCKQQRLYCIQCIKNGIHVSHPQNQEELPKMFEHIQQVEIECDDLTNKMTKQMDLLQQDFYLLIEGIRSKYKISKQQILNLNSQQMNSYVQQSVNFTSNQYNYAQMNSNLKQKNQYLNYNQLNQVIIKYLTYIQINQKNYIKMAIKILDKALSFNTKHQLSLYSKAESLRMLGQYNEAIIWADKALQVNPKDCFSLRTKGHSLRLLKDYKEALKAIDQSLSINPNHLSSLQSKGHCLQNQNNYQEALLFYEIALKINSNHQWTKNRKDECLKALNTK
ncbi:unnamed protein product [Paramecium primaurelia]|uniref:Tetratricopeptide repeat protein n=1 Tax=Paramecium primaurelia TaxID=5886 RepID=A0A8S1NWK2_PARPR|nr:unnamed protein product [Paramecium primaurelia]